jgi:hypothetical protein
MKLNLNGVEIELPNNARVDVSEDGKSVKIGLPEPEVIEKIKVVEVESEERVVERIRVVEVDRYIPCTLPHYPCNRQHYPYPNWTYTTTTGNIISGGITQSPNTIQYDGSSGQITCGQSSISCNNPNILSGTADASNITYTSTN